MEKFFFKTTTDGKCIKKCLYRKDNTMIGSIECNRCEYNKGFDNFYNWVRCVFYSIHTENYNLYKKLKRYEDKINQLENELASLKGGL